MSDAGDAATAATAATAAMRVSTNVRPGLYGLACLASLAACGGDDRLIGALAPDGSGGTAAGGAARAGAGGVATEGSSGAPWPSESTTGHRPTGVSLSYYTGPAKITKAGAVFDGKTFPCLEIAAPGVVIKRSLVRCGGATYAVTVDTGADVQIEDTEIAGHTNAVTGVGPAGFVLTRAYVHNVGVAAELGDGAVIRDSFLQIAAKCATCTTAAVTGGGAGVALWHNSIEKPDAAGDLVSLSGAGATVENNLLNGGNYELSCAAGGAPAAGGVIVTGNHFGRHLFPNGGSTAAVGHFDACAAGGAWSGNVWDDTGAPVGP